MQVTVKLYASFCIGRFTSEVRDYPDAVTVSAIAVELGIPEEFLIRLRNGRHASPDEVVAEGDTISFLPMLEGG